MIKPYRFFAIIVLSLLIVGFVINADKLPTSKQNTMISMEGFYDIFPGAQPWRQPNSNPPFFYAVNTQGKPIGYLFYNADFAPDIKGYSGNWIQLAVGLDLKGNIIGIKLLRHKETPQYADQIPKLLESIRGKNLQELFILGENIDGISGATITSKTIVDSLNESASKIMPIILKTDRKKTTIEQSNIRIPFLIILLLFFLAGLTCIAKNTMIRWAGLISGFIALGLVFHEMISTSHIAGLVLLQNPAWDQAPLLHLLLIGALAGSLLLGRIYCSSVCPFAFVEEFINTINRKFFKYTFSANAFTDGISRWIKYVLLIGMLTACFLLKQSGIGAAEVYITLFSGKGSIVAWTLVGVVLFASFFYRRFWCKYLCPCGAFLALIAQLRLYNKSAIASSNETMCADAAECFYCDQCYRNDIHKSTTTQNYFFIILIIVSTVLFGSSFIDTIKSTQTPEQQKTIAPVITQAYHDSETALKELQQRGITPHPAKYWKVMNDER